jgi:integrase
MKGSVYKRCKCRGADGKELGTTCPSLRRKDGSYAQHGSWYFRLELDPEPATDDDGNPVLGADGEQVLRRRTVRRAVPTASTKDDAEAALSEARGLKDRGVDVSRKMTVADYLSEWTAGLGHLSPNTQRSYSQHCRTWWIPKLGRIEVKDLRRAHVQAALDALDLSAASKQRYRATLRVSLNDAVREGLVSVNVATLVKISAGKRPKARPWTDARVLQFEAELTTRLAAARERAKGQRISAFKVWCKPELRPSPVMVWTPAQVERFLLHVTPEHPRYAMYHVIAFRGLRRGEAVGMRRQDLDLDTGQLTVAWQLTKGGGVIAEGPVKTDASDATIKLDAGTVWALQDHLRRAAERRREWSSAWVESGFVFTREDGSRLDPETVTDEFMRLSYDAGLPPVRLHDLRHAAASMMHAAGVDMKRISKTLRHATTAITSDTYTSVFEDEDHEAAELTAGVISLPWAAPATPARSA